MAKCPRSHSCRWQIWGSTWDCPAPTGTTHCGDLPGACTESIRGPQRRAACLQSVLCCVSGRLSLRDTKHVCMTLDPGGEPPTPPHLRTTLPAPRWAGAGGYSEPGAGSPRLKQMLQEHVPGERRARPGLGPGVTGQGRSAAPLQNSRHIRRLRQRPRGQRPLRALRRPTGPAQPPPLSCLPGLAPQGRGSGPWLSALHPVAQKMGRMIPACRGERGDVRRGRGPAHRREDPRRPRCPAAVACGPLGCGSVCSFSTQRAVLVG